MSEQRTSRAVFAIVFVSVASVITGLDLWTKKAVFELLNVQSVGDPPHVVFPHDRYEIIPNWFELEANYNYGAFSGMLGAYTGWLAVLSAVALLVIAGIFVHQLRQPKGPGWLLTLSLGLLWGGTCGNLYDRAALRAVRDWIKWFYVTSDGKEHVWPNFNIADSAICTGVGILILLEVLRARSQKRSADAAEQAAAPGAQTTDAS